MIRLAPTVHGPRDHGFVPMLIATARATGISACIGNGSNRWPAVHRLDAADLYRLALEEAPAGQVLHGVGEAAVPFKNIAQTIGHKLSVPIRSITTAQAGTHFANPFMAAVYATDAPVSSEHTQHLLGWSPHHRTLLEDLDHGDYTDPPA